MKTIDQTFRSAVEIRPAPAAHILGDGLPVRNMFDYDDPLAPLASPFVFLDYVGPAQFKPGDAPGVDTHPHRGIETVTLVYKGELEHRDSKGNHGVIGAGDVQWMTAGAGILHQEKSSAAFRQHGGDFELIQLWVNLSKRDKFAAPGYQSFAGSTIPTVDLPHAGRVRVVAGSYDGVQGPAKTFTPITLLDFSLREDSVISIPLTASHSSAIFVRSGELQLVDENRVVKGPSLAFLSAEGMEVRVKANSDAAFLVLGGEPINEPIVGRGPFVMNSAEQIQQAYADVRAGRFGQVQNHTVQI